MKETGKQLVILFALVVFGAGLVVYAWTPPVGPPPGLNASKPFTVSDRSEEKVGIPNPSVPFPQRYDGIIAVNDIFIRSVNLWASELSDNYNNVFLRPTQDVKVVVKSSGASSPYVTCDPGYQLVGCSGSRVYQSSGPIIADRDHDYLGTILSPIGYGVPDSCRTEVRPFTYSISNHRPVAYAYCMKTRFYDCGFPGIPCD